MAPTISDHTIDAFWQTVLRKRAQLAVATSTEDDAYNACLASLQAISEGLYLEFSTSESPRELIVTAEGERSLFPAVREIVARAPEVPGWIVLGLKPGLGFPEVTRWEGVEIRTLDVFFDPLAAEGDDRLGLRFYVPNLRPEDRTSAHNALLRACDHGLGEEAFAESVGYTEIAVLPADCRPDEFIPLTDLERYIRWHLARRAGGAA